MSLLPLNEGRIVDVELREQMKHAYLDYAMSVIVGRALPDVRDGLKPVHRRILYGMQQLGMYPDKAYKKSARLVGEVLGKYHPHGDTSVYDAMVRLAQDFNMRYMLVDGHGNFGTLDDSAAAMRYTEARLAKISMEMLQDLDAETVDMMENYDGSETEPTVMPAGIPNLLLNGSQGIAVGMATNIPPHNLGELVNAISHLIDHPEADIAELQDHVLGPDFPTGGFIMGSSGITDAYTTGRGSIIIRAKADIETSKQGTQIVVTEMPYQVSMERLEKHIVELIKDKKIDGISDLRNESDREGLRFVIELKRDAVAQIVLNNLYKQTSLQTSFGVIMLALVNKQPKVLNLKQVLTHYIEHRVEIITRRSRYYLRQAEERAHILQGYLTALTNLDSVVQIIRAAPNGQAAQEVLMERYGLSKLQANAILEMQLRRLTGLEREKIETEFKQQQQRIADLTRLLGDPQLILKQIKHELRQVADKHDNKRRTQIMPAAADSWRHEDLIPDEPMAIFLTEQGYLKRVSQDTFEKQRRGGRGIGGMGTRDDDYIRLFFTGTAHNTILFFSNRGVSYSLKVYEVPEAGRQAKGMNIANMLQLAAGEVITAVIPVTEFKDDEYLVMLTRRGVIKKTELSKFCNIRRTGLIAIGLEESDELRWVRMTDGKQHILIGTANGMAINFPESEIRCMGRTAMGVRGIKLRSHDTVVGMDIGDASKDLLVVTTDGYGKRTAMKEYREQGRGGIGLITVKLNQKRQGKVANVMAVSEENEIVLVTGNGIVIRQRVAEIPCLGRCTQGVRLQRLSEDDRVAGVALVTQNGLDKDEEEPPLTLLDGQPSGDGA